MSSVNAEIDVAQGPYIPVTFAYSFEAGDNRNEVCRTGIGSSRKSGDRGLHVGPHLRRLSRQVHHGELRNVAPVLFITVLA